MKANQKINVVTWGRWINPPRWKRDVPANTGTASSNLAVTAKFLFGEVDEVGVKSPALKADVT